MTLKFILKLAEKSTLTLGVFLFLINISGIFISLRDESIDLEKAGFVDDITLSEKEFYDKIHEKIVNRKEYITNLNQAVNQSIAHYWKDEWIEKYNLRIPFYENYLLFIASFLYPAIYLKYEFVDYRRAVERGVGLCSQQAIITSAILEEKRIPSFIVGLSGHVVLRAQADENRDEWWLLDPDYGVIIPHDIYIIEDNPKLIEPFYAKAGHSKRTIALLERIYEKKGNVVSRDEGIRGYARIKYFTEPIFYYLKWFIPFTLITASVIIFCVRKRKGKRKKSHFNGLLPKPGFKKRLFD